jgi:hypothetical protein
MAELHVFLTSSLYSYGCEWSASRFDPFTPRVPVKFDRLGGHQSQSVRCGEEKNLFSPDGNLTPNLLASLPLFVGILSIYS